jgi:putative two-component system response regulator
MTDHTGASILVVEDDPAVGRLARRLLEKSGFSCTQATSAAEALDLVARDAPDLVLTDVSMPGASGIALLNALSPLQPDVASVVMTGSGDPDVGYRALSAGAYGYVQKPFSSNELLVTINGALRRRTVALANRADRAELERDLDDSRLELIERLARAVESRDSETGAHVDRMSILASRIARMLGWDDADAERLRVASTVHDIGKVGLPDSILLKAGPLTATEREQMEAHCENGRALLAGGKSELLQLAETIAWTHHERVDGSGYPRGISGDAILPAARIAAVADVFDALTSARPYRAALDVEDALAIMREDAGLDELVVRALERLI